MAVVAERIKVVYNDEKLVINIRNMPSESTVEELMQTRVGPEFAAHLGKNVDEVNFVEIRTADGFILPKAHPISAVIKYDEVLTVVDSVAWTKTQEKLIQHPAWHTIGRSDFSDELRKYLEVGMHKHNKIFAAVTRGKEIVQIALLDMFELRNTSENKRKILSYKGYHPKDRKITWNASVHLCVEGQDDEKRMYLEMSLQSCSDPQPEVHTLELLDDGTHITPQKHTQIQAPYPAVYKRYTVPENTATGPSLDELSKKEAEAPAPKPFEGNKSTGDSPLVLEQIDKVYPDESWKRDNVIYNIMMVQIRVQNTSHHDEPVYITKVESEYQDKSGNWHASTHSGIGSKNGYYNFSWHRPPHNIPFSKKDSALSAISAEIPITGALQADRRRRVHDSLPYPLPIRWTVTDNSGKTTKLNVLCYHEDKIKAPTREQKEKDSGSPYDWWVQLDDLNALHRMWAGGKHNIQEHNFTLAVPNSTLTISQDTLHRAIWSALHPTKDDSTNNNNNANSNNNTTNSKLSEASLGFPSNGNTSDWSIEAKVVFDAELRHPYALHITGKSSTSTVESYKLLPSEL